MEWEEYGKKFELGRDPFFKNVFWLPWQGTCPKTYAILLCIHVFQFPHVLGATGVFPVCLDPTFWLLASFFPWIGGRFCNARAWVVFLTFFGAAGAFSIHVFGSFMCFYHGYEGPFTFLTVSATIDLTHRIFGAFSPCCELCSMISFRAVCVSSCVSRFCCYVWGCVIRFSLFKL